MSCSADNTAVAAPGRSYGFAPRVGGGALGIQIVVVRFSIPPDTVEEMPQRILESNWTGDSSYLLWWQIINDFPPLPNSTGNSNVMEIAHKLGGWSARRGEQISQFTENPYISFFWTPSASMSGARCNLHSEGRILHLALSHLVRFFIEWVGKLPSATRISAHHRPTVGSLPLKTMNELMSHIYQTK